MTDAATANAAHAPGARPHRVILASAGSGKTYQLTGRYVELLRTGVDPSTVLATTFTRKAAGEIFAKTVGRLASGDEGDRRLIAELGRRVDRLSVSTLDGFFARLIGAFRFELGLPLEPRYLDDDAAEARDLRLQAIEAVLADGARSEDTLATLVTLMKRLHHDAVQRSVTDALDDIVRGFHELYREAPQAEAWDRLDTGTPLSDEALTHALEAIRGLAASIDAKRVTNAMANDLAAASEGRFDDVVGKGLGKAILQNHGVYYGKPLPGEVIDAYAPLLDHARAVLLSPLAFQTRATHELLSRYDAHFAELRRARGVMRFADATHALSRELFDLDAGDLADAFFRLDTQVQHLLLDEFQDTSLEQWRVLRPFAEEATSQERSFFCVGDPKQAIYGWRGGEAALFGEVLRLPGLGEGDVSTLATSWRSSPIVLDAVNTVFASIDANAALAGKGDVSAAWRERFETHSPAPHHASLPGHVTLRTTARDDEGPAEEADDEADDDTPAAVSPHLLAAAGFIASLHDPAQGRSIGVLMRTNRSASRLLYELRRRGLPVSGEGGVPLTDTPAVNAMLSALALADHPGDEPSAFHVANSPLGPALGLETRDDRDVLRFAASVRASLQRRGYAATLADWARRVSDHCSARSRRRLDRLIELAEQYDAGPADLRASRFVAHAEAASIEEPAASTVRVMTVHKSKGLEFDAVVLPELDGRFRFNPTVLVDRDGPTGPVTGVVRAGDQATRALSPPLTALAERAEARELEEWLCLLYVAMTRARHALHLLVQPLKAGRDGRPTTRGRTDLSYAAVLRQGLLDPADLVDLDGPGEVLYEIGDPDWAAAAEAEASATQAGAPRLVSPRLGLSPSPAPRTRLTVAASAAGRDRATAAELLGEASPVGLEARRVGSLVHRMFEAVAFLDEQQPSDAALRQAARAEDPALDDAAIDRAVAAFHRVIAAQAVRDALSRRGATGLWREQAFALRDGDRLLLGRFDRVVFIPAGDAGPASAVVIDFKTDRITLPGVDDAVAHHAPQMHAYRRAAAAWFGLPLEQVTAELVFTAAGVVASLPGREA